SSMKLILILLKIIFLSFVGGSFFYLLNYFTGLNIPYTEFMLKLFPISVLAIGMAYWQKNSD
ncbi:hypothetical protein N5886_11055, partial [Glaesserella parasuis]|nr:hypothetical protein [Glaesserella parasuis]